MRASAWIGAASARSKTSARPTGRSSTACASAARRRCRSATRSRSAAPRSSSASFRSRPPSARSRRCHRSRRNHPGDSPRRCRRARRRRSLPRGAPIGPWAPTRPAAPRPGGPAPEPKTDPKTDPKTEPKLDAGPASLSLKLHIDFSAGKATVAVDDGKDPLQLEFDGDAWRPASVGLIDPRLRPRAARSAGGSRRRGTRAAFRSHSSRSQAPRR